MLAELDRLPKTPDDITAEWLSSALGHEVLDAKMTDVIWGTATKIRLRLSFADDKTPLPNAVCVKGGFDERLRSWGLGPSYVLESRFFTDLAPRLKGVPRSHFTAVSRDGDQGVIVMDDLVATGCTFGDPTRPWTPHQVADALEVIAGWHATAPTRRSWLPVGAGAARDAAATFLTRDHWDAHFAQQGAPDLPPGLQDPDRLMRAFQRLWTLDDAAPHVVSHGDAHLGNAYVDADGNPGFLDWQTVCLGPWSYDVAYFIGGALAVEDRRRSERGLLEHYLRALATGGGPDINLDAAWPEYVRHTLHGILWAATPAVMQPLERIVAMAQRYAAAMEDHDTLEELSA